MNISQSHPHCQSHPEFTRATNKHHRSGLSCSSTPTPGYRSWSFRGRRENEPCLCPFFQLPSFLHLFTTLVFEWLISRPLPRGEMKVRGFSHNMSLRLFRQNAHYSLRLFHVKRMSKKYPLPTRSGVQMLNFVPGSGFRQHDVGTFVGMGKGVAYLHIWLL